MGIGAFRAIVVTVATGSVKANTMMNTMRQYILFESKVAPLIYGHSIRQSPFFRRGMLLTDPTQFTVHLDAFILSGHVLLGLHGRKEIKFILLLPAATKLWPRLCFYSCL